MHKFDTIQFTVYLLVCTFETLFSPNVDQVIIAYQWALWHLNRHPCCYRHSITSTQKSPFKNPKGKEKKKNHSTRNFFFHWTDPYCFLFRALKFLFNVIIYPLFGCMVGLLTVINFAPALTPIFTRGTDFVNRHHIFASKTFFFVCTTGLVL